MALDCLFAQQIGAASWIASGPLHTARWEHTATLMFNGKVLVVGGHDGTNAIADAEQYDAATSQWTETSDLECARWGHTATMLPNGNVLVAGGYGGGYLSSAEIYDPATGSWTVTGAMTMARLDHTATLLVNGMVLVVGGRSSSNYLSSAELYDPITGVWTSASTMTAARSSHTATLLPSGKVLVAGGFDFSNNTGVWLNSTEVYDSISGTWTASGIMIKGRSSHTTTLLPNGKVLAVGGSGQAVHTNNVLASAEIYDPTNQTWTAARALTTGRWVHTATLLPNGKVLVAGGEASVRGAIPNTELYDPDAGEWAQSATLKDARVWHTASVLSNGRVLLVGGATNGNGSQILSTTELYDYVGGTWAKTSSMTNARQYHTSTLLPNGSLLVAGGGSGAPLVSAELYDPVNATWTATGSLNKARVQHTATLLFNGKVLVAGGAEVTGNSHSKAELYDPNTGTWSATSSMRTARFFHVASLLQNGKVLVAGGHNSANAMEALRTAELFDPATSSWTSTSSMSIGREYPTATLLPNGKVLLAGGLNGLTALGSAELYDPISENWAETQQMNVAREYHTATVLLDGKVLVTGGQNSTRYLRHSELYDPITGVWTPTGQMNETRQFHTATLLPNGMVLVAGGYNGRILSSAETYDPATGRWTMTGTLNWPHSWCAASLLPNGKVVVTGSGGGVASAFAELFDVGLGFRESWQPTFSGLTWSLRYGTNLTLTGALFRGVSEASSGTAQSSSHNYPLVQLRNLENGQTTFLLTTNWSESSFSSAPVIGLPLGWTLVTVFVNGIPSSSAITALVKGTATVTLGDLSQYYDGTAKQVSVTISPPGLNVDLTYNGSKNAPTNVGSYTVVGIIKDPNYEGSVTNTLVISQATLSILVHPVSQKVSEGGNVTFVVKAEGKPQPWYQWKRGMANINGATNSSLSLSNVQYADSGEYSVLVQNGYLSSESSKATLTVNRVPTAFPKIVSLNEDTPTPITLSGSDPEQDPLIFIPTARPEHGTLTGTGSMLTYTPNLNRYGRDGFTFKVNDGLADSAPATVSITVQPVNDPPEPRIVISPLTRLPGSTNLVVVAPVCDNPWVLLDASQSCDVERDPLQFTWNEGTNLLGTTAMVTNRFAPGSHTIRLQVGDGLATVSLTRTLRVVSPGEAVGALAQALQTVNLHGLNPQSLLGSLRAAAASFDRCNRTSGLNQLAAFQQKVVAQIAPRNPTLADTLMQQAEELLDILGDSRPRRRSWAHLGEVSPGPAGRLKLKFGGPKSKTCFVEASTNLLTWETIGVAEAKGNGIYEFEDPLGKSRPWRFYRLVSP